MKLLTESERQEFVELSLFLANCQCKVIVPPEYFDNYRRYTELFARLHKVENPPCGTESPIPGSRYCM